jgi:hypothetical protein
MLAANASEPSADAGRSGAADPPGDAGRLGLERLLQHPAIWRGRSTARVSVVSSGFPALDAALPGGGWPRVGLVEMLVSDIGVGELDVLLPALAALTRKDCARRCGWVAPPFEPFAPVLSARGVVLERMFVARTGQPLWAFEQALLSGACEVVLAWAPQAPARDIRRLQLAAEQGHALGVLFRPLSVARESSNAVLRVIVEPTEQGSRVTLLKSRGGQRGGIDLVWSHYPTQERVIAPQPERSDSSTGSL